MSRVFRVLFRARNMDMLLSPASPTLQYWILSTSRLVFSPRPLPNQFTPASVMLLPDKSNTFRLGEFNLRIRSIIMQDTSSRAFASKDSSWILGCSAMHLAAALTPIWDTAPLVNNILWTPGCLSGTGIRLTNSQINNTSTSETSFVKKSMVVSLPALNAATSTRDDKYTAWRPVSEVRMASARYNMASWLQMCGARNTSRSGHAFPNLMNSLSNTMLKLMDWPAALVQCTLVMGAASSPGP
mmetsp:Transcript_31288/g.81199  ORF Transcript_31288/g.81199 Transcript_31288/m.81199 type:complete len:242 (-) Transcript_31288:355-1080(-)